MRLCTVTTLLSILFLCTLFIVFCIQPANGQARRLRIRPQSSAVQLDEIDEDAIDEEELTDDYDTQPQQPVQYYTPNPLNRSSPPGRYVVSSNDDYNGLYGQPTTPTPRSRIDYNRPIGKSSTAAPLPIKVKENQTKAPPVQTIRNYNKVNDDGSFTFGYEAADGSFKEETRGTDCVVRGKYGYIDPDGNKREFTYVSGNPCDPNHPDETEEDDRERSEEDANEPENIPQNYPRRPIKPVSARPSTVNTPQQYSRPAIIQTTTHAPPTTVFQNIYSSSNTPYLQKEDDEEEQPDDIQVLQHRLQPQQQQQYPQQLLQQQQQQQHQQQPQQRLRPTQRPHLQQQQQEEVTIRERPRITVANTTPAPHSYHTPTAHPVSITPRPTYRIPQQTIQTQLPATTYRPQLQFITQKPTTSNAYQQKPTQSPLSVEPLTKTSYSSVRKPIDFAVEFQKFQQEHNSLQPSTTPRHSSSISPAGDSPSTQRPFKPSVLQKIELGNPTSNPIYESQLVFDPSTGQYDSALFQQLPQSEGDFSLSSHHLPYVPQPAQFQAQHSAPQLQSPQIRPQPGQLVSLEQLAQHNQQPLYHRATNVQSTRSPLQFPPPQSPQREFSQQVYHKDHDNNQVVSSQQLYAQQQELQHQQLHNDRIEAAKRQQQIMVQHQQQQQQRFQYPSQQQQIRPQIPQQQAPQGFYFVQPQQQLGPQTSGHIDAFLRGHNIEFN